jgi:hypothetical protein
MAYHKDIIKLFKELAELYFGHSETENHFCPNGIGDLQNSEVSNLKNDILVLEGYDYKYIDKKSGNVLKERTVGYWVLRHISDSDYKIINQAKDELELLGDKVLNQFVRWRNEIQRQYTNAMWQAAIFKDFDFEDVEVSEVENLGDCWYGYFFTVKFITPHNTTL